MSYATVTLTGRYLQPDGRPAEGRVKISPTAPVIKDSVGNIILVGTSTVSFDANGSFQVELPATDDVNLSPTDWGYTFEVWTRHGGRQELFQTYLPTLPVGDSYDMADLTPVVILPPTVVAESTEGAQAKATAALNEAKAYADGLLDGWDTALSGKADLDEDGRVVMTQIPATTAATANGLPLRRELGTLAGPSDLAVDAAAADDLLTKTQVQELINAAVAAGGGGGGSGTADVRKIYLAADVSTAESTTWLDLMGIADAETDQQWEVSVFLVYEATETGGIQIKLSDGDPGLTAGATTGWSMLGSWQGLALSGATVSTMPQTSEQYNRVMPVRYGAKINPDAASNTAQSFIAGGLGLGTPVCLWGNFDIKVGGSALTNGIIRPIIRQRTTDAANPTIVRAKQSFILLSRST